MKTYHLNRTNREYNFKIEATCIEDNGRFILKKGSIISPYELNGLSKRMKKIRETAPIGENHLLKEDMTFDSLYDAACFVIGTNASDKWFQPID